MQRAFSPGIDKDTLELEIALALIQRSHGQSAKEMTPHVTNSTLGPKRTCLLAAGTPTDTVDIQNLRTFAPRQIYILLAERPMPALLLRRLLQCAGDVEMNHGPVSTPTPNNCLWLMQWNSNESAEKSVNC